MSLNRNDAEVAKFVDISGEIGVRTFLIHGDNWREAVADFASLPSVGNTLGDIRQTSDSGSLYRWNGTAWELYDSNVGSEPSATLTSLSSKGGALINIDSATGDIARTTAGDLENNSALGLYARQDVAGWSVEADTVVTRTGTKTLKISTTSVAGAASVIVGADNREATYAGTKNRLYPLKASTKYIASCWAKTSGVAAASVFLTAWEWNVTYTGRVFNVSNTLTGTNDWTLLTLTFTTNAATTQGTLSVANSVAGNISDAWFDINSMTLEEVVEPVANSLNNVSPSIQSFTAVGSTDNIDQSFTTAPNYLATVGEAGGLQYREAQSFTPTKSKLIGVYLYKSTTGGTPTGNVVVDIRTDSAGSPSATVLATYTIPLATFNALTTNAEFLVNLPCNLTIGSSYWITVSNTATEGAGNAHKIGALSAGGYTGGVSKYSTDGGTSWTLNGTVDIYFKTLYYKPTTNFKASQNNTSISISADEDGFQYGSVINLINASYSMYQAFGYSGTGHLIAYDTLTGNPAVQGIIQSGFTDRFRFDYAGNYLTTKVNFGGTASNIVVGTKFVTGGTNGRTQNFQYSTDNSTWNDLVVSTTSNNTVESTYSIPGSMSTVYIRWYNTQANSMNVYYLDVDATIDTSTIPTLYNYPTNKDRVQLYTKSLSSATTTAIYRATKFGFPAIEYSNGEYQFLESDTTATGSSVSFSPDGTTYTVVADGGSIVLSSTVNPQVWVKTNITANRIYVSSNDYNASSDKDGSNMMNLVYSVKEQGIIYDINDLQKEIEIIRPKFTESLKKITGDIDTVAESYSITPTATGNINLLKVPQAGKKFSIIVNTSGTTSYTLTFNTNFISTGTLATGVVDAKYFTVNFISDGIRAIETSRTTAM